MNVLRGRGQGSVSVFMGNRVRVRERKKGGGISMCMKWSPEEVHRCGEELGVCRDGEG